MRRLVIVIAPILLIAACLGYQRSRPQGDDDTDEIARVVALAVSWPRLDTAQAYLRVVLDTKAGEDGRLTVIRAVDVPHDDLDETWVSMVWRIRPDVPVSGNPEPPPRWFSWPGEKPRPYPFYACYRVDFSYYGEVEQPPRIDCPRDRTAVLPKPLPTMSPTPEPSDDGLSVYDEYIRSHGG